MNNLYRFVSTLTLLVGFCAVSIGQTAPNCKDVNASLDVFGDAHLSLEQFVTNIGTNSATLSIVRRNGDVVLEPTLLTYNQMVTIAACPFRDEQLKMSVSIDDLGACWSALTFKQSNGPQLLGRAKDVYCYDPLVKGGHIDDELPLATIACLYNLEVTHSSDWVVPYACTPTAGDAINDTAKVIYREYEAFDKEGRRGTVFDTITVFNIPPVTLGSTANTYCAEKDTTYCGDGFAGPYMLVPERCDPGVVPGDFDGDLSPCDTLYFLVYDSIMNVWVENPIFTEYKCGILVHVDKTNFPASSCDKQIKYSVDIKQSCLGTIRTECLIDPNLVANNAIVEIAPGYYRCEFWLIDLDTVPPIVECKFDKLDDHNVAWPRGFIDSTHVDFDGNTPYHCFDVPISPSNDTTAPVIIVSTSSHDCVAHTYIPPVCVYDAWSGVKQVKAQIPGFGSWILTSNGEECDELDTYTYPGDTDYNVTGICYESHVQVPLPKAEEPYQILYEVYDSCHNIDSIYCYIFVKDRISPDPVVDKGVTVSLTSKKVWVDAESFDEGSSDNCGVNMFLVRRTDWYEECVTLCDSIKPCCWGQHEDTLYQAFLQPDKHVDEIEAYYARTLDWLKNDGTPCANLIYNAWQYDLMKHATLKCKKHPYEVGDEYFRKLFTKCYEDYLYDTDLTTMYDIDPGDPIEYCLDRWCLVSPFDLPGCGDHDNLTNEGLAGYDFFDESLLESEKRIIELYETIGGGWSDKVPFTCDDACGPVTVEILVMDYWCNWSLAWSKVWVEDKTPAKVAKDVYDEQITCKTYKDQRYSYPGEAHPVSLEYIVEAGKAGDSTGLALLDEVFGGYCKAWVDPYGNYVDIDGNEIECDIPFYDSTCYCTTDVEKVRVYEDHHGYIWKDSLITDCYYDQDTLHFQKGIVVVNCDDNVYCEQEVWCDIDHCGQGYIYRKWKIWQGCPASYYHDENVPDSLKHPVDTIYRSQRIYVGNKCDLSKYMFDVPADETVYACGVTYDPDGSGNLIGDAGPESTGYATYKFDDDCRLVGIAHDDRVFKIVGGEQGCYKILRTWYFADWCGYGTPVSGNWWKDYELVTDSCVQKILVFDTIPPVCTITGPVESGDTVITGSCAYGLSVDVEVSDQCGVQKYYWELKDITDAKSITVYDSGHGTLNADTTDQFSITPDDVYPGSYKLKVTVQDECNNESHCEYYVQIVSGKKPTPICITSLTARLTPWDRDHDGEVDTAHAVVWAGEFNSSSEMACHDDSIAYRIEFVDGDADSTYLEDADSLNLGCADVGQHIVRLWVLSYPSATVDYCDVVLVIQSDNTGCDLVGQGGRSGAASRGSMDMGDQRHPARSLDVHDVDINAPADVAGHGGFSLANAYGLGQNRPNPFRDETVINFTLPTSMPAIISVYDVAGRVIREVRGDFNKGQNAVSFRKDDLGVNGILYYRLQAGEFTATKRMIMLR